MWHASAAWWPKTTSCTTGLRVRAASKNTQRCGRRSLESLPLMLAVSSVGSWPGFGSCSLCHCSKYAFFKRLGTA